MGLRNWRSVFINLGFAIAILLVGGLAVSQDDRDNNIAGAHDHGNLGEITTVPIRDNLYLIRGSGSNATVLIGEQGALVVDTGVEEMTAELGAAIDRLTDKGVAYVINTHSHHDHREGNAFFRKKGAEIIAHANTLDNMIGDQYAPTGALDLPTITFDGALEFSFAGETIRVIHIADAHTNGDAIIHFTGADVIAAGDLFVHCGLPFISEGAGATIDGYLAGQTTMLSQISENTLIVPGHGPLADRQQFIATNNKLTVIRNRIAALKARGISGRYTRLFFPTRNSWGDWREQGTGIPDKYFIHIVHRTLPDDPAGMGS